MSNLGRLPGPRRSAHVVRTLEEEETVATNQRDNVNRVALGADHVLLDEPGAIDTAKGICGGSRPALALNAVGGESALRLRTAWTTRISRYRSPMRSPPDSAIGEL